MPDQAFNLTVLISGNGSNLQALIDACASSALPSTRITRVISNKADAYGLTRASNASIPSTVHSLDPYKARFPNAKKPKLSSPEARSEYCKDLAKLALEATPKPDLIVCAGWMLILTPTFLTPVAEAGIKIINLHPALPGEFDGIDAIGRAHKAFLAGEIKRTGVMIHEVIEDVDAGQPVVTQEVEMREGESIEELEARIHEVEHGLIVEGTRRTLLEIGERRKAGGGA
ncbi:phosphoribosylglycinamide formyltransferase [Lophium mytilinum]|uniref:Phosphoribosylglycinamide formyltransferase n=1 Tax=Lophium mytilinum TaxID=390894 RepID=A0A6A6R2I1_9PEZI|nr:phosphoribosylglycinamide formyltransferase [Lophium mytilinum]